MIGHLIFLTLAVSMRMTTCSYLNNLAESCDANCKAATLLQTNSKKQAVSLHSENVKPAKPELKVTGEGNFYNASGYKPGVWNYDYSQTAGSCPLCTTTNKCGPSCWATIPSASNACGGTQQTPIDIDTKSAVISSTIIPPTFSTMGGGCSSWTQFVDDHVDEIDFFDGNCHNLSTTFNGVTYALKQFHFHTHSEHTVDGKPADAEMHMVHVSPTNQLLVLGVLLEGTHMKSKSFLDIFWKASKQGANADGYPRGDEYSEQYDIDDSQPLNPYTFLPQSQNFYTYAGSLTTVPCTQGVTWIVYEQPVYVREDDIVNLVSAVSNSEYTITLASYKHSNYRPVQPLNNRIVQKYVQGNL